MKNLVIDIGNTRLKSALFEGNTLVSEFSFENMESALITWNSLEFDRCLISSVKYSGEELVKILPFDFQFLDRSSRIPIANRYGTPATLGLDRIAAAVGGWQMAGNGPVLIIDMGSCITFDLVDQDNAYRGGAISPGMSMRAKAMHEQTARLPLIDLGEKPDTLVGDNTSACMQIGIWYGVEFEILGQIGAYLNQFPKIRVFICGGDSQSFESLTKDLIFVVPNLVLHGLNCILNHNVD
jgi:type III pantothenate kinase